MHYKSNFVSFYLGRTTQDEEHELRMEHGGFGRRLDSHQNEHITTCINAHWEKSTIIMMTMALEQRCRMETSATESIDLTEVFTSIWLHVTNTDMYYIHIT